MLSRLLHVSFEYLPGWQVLGLYLLLAAPILWLGARSVAGHDPLRKWVAVGLRLDLLLFLVLLLGGVRYEREAKDLTVVVVRDTSPSAANVQVPEKGSVQQAINSYVRRQTATKPPADRVGIVSFDDHARIDALPGTTLRECRGIRDDAVGTNVAEGLQLALAALPADTLGRLVLFWDGNATGGDLDSALNAAAAQRVPIDVVPLRYDVAHEIAVQRVIAPAFRSEHEAFTIDVLTRSGNMGAVRAKLTVTDNGLPVDLDPLSPGVQATRTVELWSGLNVEHVKLPPLPGGAHQFRGHIETAVGEQDADTLAGNNSGEAVTLVRGRGRILFVQGRADGGAAALSSALRRSGIVCDDDVIAAPAFPRSLAALQGYDAVVLADVARGLGGLDDVQDRMLARYVRELGGGLVMVGGPQSFGAGGWIGSEVEKVLPVDCQPLAREMMPPGALVLVIDHSGSMDGGIPGSARTKQEVANEAATLALTALAPQDRVGVLAFDAQPTWVVPLGPNDEPAVLQRAIREIRPAGGTSIYPALVEAYRALLPLVPEQAVVKHVLLLTDGQSQTRGDYAGLAGKMARAGITLSTVGVGEDADRKLLASLARLGRGRFYPVADAREIPQVFVKEALTLRNALIREQSFAPRVVGASSPMVSGIGWLPPLRGLVATWPKQSGYVQVPAVADAGEVVLAHWRVGLGQAAAFTSDGGGRWATAWARSPVFAKFWTQVVRTVARPSGSTVAQARMVAGGAGRARIIVEAAEAGGEWQGVVGVSATILGPDAREAAKSVRLTQVGPSLYQGELDTPQPGPYLGLVRLAGAGGDGAWVPAAYVADASQELRDLRSNEAAIAQVASRTGGRVLEPFDRDVSLFDRSNLERRRVSLPLTGWLIGACLLTLLLDVAARRIAWDRQQLAAAGAACAAFIRQRTQVRVGDARRSLRAWREVRWSVARRAEIPSWAAEVAERRSAEPQGSIPADAACDRPVGQPAASPTPARIEQGEAPAGADAADPMRRLAEAKRRAASRQQ